MSTECHSWLDGILGCMVCCLSLLAHRLTRLSSPASREQGSGSTILRMEDVSPALCGLFSLGFHLTGYALNCSKNAYCTLIQIWLQTCEQFLAHELLRSNKKWPIGNALKAFWEVRGGRSWLYPHDTNADASLSRSRGRVLVYKAISVS